MTASEAINLLPSVIKIWHGEHSPRRKLLFVEGTYGPNRGPLASFAALKHSRKYGAFNEEVPHYLVGPETGHTQSHTLNKYTSKEHKIEGLNNQCIHLDANLLRIQKLSQNLFLAFYRYLFSGWDFHPRIFTVRFPVDYL